MSELDDLIAEQRRDDTSKVWPEFSGTVRFIDTTRKYRDPWECALHGRADTAYHTGKPVCRICRREYMRAWRAKHPGYNREYMRKHRQKVREAARAAGETTGVDDTSSPRRRGLPEFVEELRRARALAEQIGEVA